MLSVKEAQKPTMAELLAQLHEINKLEPVEIEIPARKDRPNPLLEMPDQLLNQYSTVPIHHPSLQPNARDCITTY